jgi:hypothetical protein
MQYTDTLITHIMEQFQFEGHIFSHFFFCYFTFLVGFDVHELQIGNIVLHIKQN